MIRINHTSTMLRFSLFCCTFLHLSCSWAFIPLEVTLEEFSKSGKTMVVNRGFVDDLQEGDWGKFYLKRGTLEHPKLFLLAEGELVKSFPKKSYWLIRKVHLQSSFLPQTLTYLVTQNQVNFGRKIRISQKDVTLAPEREGEGPDDPFQNELAHIEESYQKGDRLYEYDESQDEEKKYTDLLVTTFGDFKINKGQKMSQEYGDELNEKIVIENRVVPIGDIKNKEDQVIFQIVTGGHEKKVHQKYKKYGVTSSYSYDVETVYRKKLEQEKEKDSLSPRLRAKILRDGRNWTSDMDDEKLRRYFIASGMEREYRRRELALNEADGHEVTLKYQNSVSTHTTDEDPNYRGGSYNLSLSYDFHLSQFSKNMKDWSLEVGLESGVASYDLGGLNGRSNEILYGTYLNFYFLNHPLSLNTFNCLFGIGVKNGSAKISSFQLTSTYSYQLSIIPALQLMTKYRFRPGDLSEESVKIGMSVNFGAALDFKQLSLNGVANDDINSKISVTDLKYTAGVSFYF